MSNRLVTAAWDAPLPGTRKIVLVYVCDRANDDGSCFFLVKKAAMQCGLSERAVQQALGELHAAGYIVREDRPGRSSMFHVADPSAWVVQDPRTTCTPARGAPPQVVHPRATCTPASGAPTPAGGAPTPAPRAPITTTKPLPNQEPVSGASASDADGQVVELAPHVVAAKAMIAAGIPATQVNPSHVELLDLAEKAPLREFELAAAHAVSTGKGFLYALGIVRGRIAEAQAAAARAPPGGTKSRKPSVTDSFEGKKYDSTAVDQLPAAYRDALERDGLAAGASEASVREARVVRVLRADGA